MAAVGQDLLGRLPSENAESLFEPLRGLALPAEKAARVDERAGKCDPADEPGCDRDPRRSTPLHRGTEGFEAYKAKVEGYTLEPGVPNPFSKDQEVAFTVPTAGVAVLEVYNAIGQRVAVLFNGETVAGQRYRAVFSGDEREAGVYFYRLTHNGKTMTQTGTLAR